MLRFSTRLISVCINMYCVLLLSILRQMTDAYDTLDYLLFDISVGGCSMFLI